MCDVCVPAVLLYSFFPVHNAHMHATFSFFNYILPTEELPIHAYIIYTMVYSTILKLLHITSSIFAATTGRNYTVINYITYLLL